ncbi:hypothetical protein MNB_SM-7-14 [hydrothermal vent metagenome]|uniref:Uncharacterized protein n=1 Tax=hydrothermal vent metagenome TaxID=652676 RepID=A0A1W1BGY0_9ZZZZ
MLYFSALFFSFLYFKIARVYKKEEKVTKAIIIQNSIVGVAILLLLVYGIIYKTWYITLLVAYLFFIVAALIVSAVQVGVFLDGKPFVKISHLHKSMPFLGAFIVLADLYLWFGL